MRADELRPPLPATSKAADERQMLRESLDYFRAVLERKAYGLTTEQLNTAVAPSELTLGGMILHMAGVEEGWFSQWFLDKPLGPPWDAVDWDADIDWEWHNVDAFTPDQMLNLFHDAVDQSRAIEAEAPSLDHPAARVEGGGDAYTLRWIMIHMIEEYARHCGHADFIRQALDGTVGS